MKINYKILIISIISVFLIGFLGSLFTAPNTGTDWYQSIKPDLTPPSFVFPIVWNILFLFISISLYLSLINSNKNKRKKIIYLFGINLLLNLLWSVIFFGLKMPILSFIELILLLISTGILIFHTKKINRAASCLLIPYFIWLVFAGILNFLIIN